MSNVSQIIWRSILIGIIATLAIDIWFEIQKRWLGIPRLNYRLVGRWIAYFPRGHFVHRTKIADARAAPGEALIGWCAHYVIGIAFAGLVIALAGPQWALHPTLIPALSVGLISIALPFFVMQPGMGAGIAGAKTEKPRLARARTIAFHLIFGCLLYCSAEISSIVLPPK